MGAGLRGAGVVPLSRQLGGAIGLTFLLRDLFTTERAAGAVHGTAAEPTGGTRTVVDTAIKLEISNPNITNILLFGDSISAASAYNPLTEVVWPQIYREYPLTIATGGARVSTRYTTFDADIATVEGTPDYIFFSLGSNDVGWVGDMVEADWKTKTRYMVEGFHTKWPNAKIYVALTWRRDYNTESTTINGWQTDIIGEYDYVFEGVDDWDCLEAGDNGVTWTADGQHPTTPAGYERRMDFSIAALALPIIYSNLGNQLWSVDGAALLGDPAIWWPAMTRAAGKIFSARVTPTWRSADSLVLGWDVNQSGYPSAGHAIRLGDSVVYIVDNSSLTIVGAYTLNSTYEVRIDLRAAGAFYFIKGGLEYPDWTLLDSRVSVSTATLYPTVQVMDNINAVGYVRVADALWLPTPLMYDTFTRANGALGSSEVVGPDSQTTPARVWTGSTWAISSNAAINTPTGVEAVSNGNMETGDPPTGWSAFGSSTLDGVADERTGGSGAQSLKVLRGSQSLVASQGVTAAAGWFLMSAWVKSDGGSNGFVWFYDNTTPYSSVANATTSWVQLAVSRYSAAANPQARLGIGSGGTEVRFDDVSIQRLDVATMFATQNLETVNVRYRVAVSALISGTQAGLVARLDNAATPANYLVAYFDGSGNIVVAEVVAGVRTQLDSDAKAFTAGDYLVLDLMGTAYRLQHITAAGVVTVISSGTTAVVTGTLFGTFSTWTGNQVDVAEAFAKGTNGEYVQLGQY